METLMLEVDTEKTFSEYEKYLEFVSEERQKRIMRFRFEKDKIISLCAGLLTRYSLGKTLNTDPKTLRFEREKNGKPYSADFENIHFSLSHSGNLIVLAVDNCRIGADTEIVKKSKENIAKSFFTNNEYKYIINSENPTKSFYMIWTMKEAFLKMTGDGLTKGLDNFDVFDANFEKMFKTYSYNDNYMITICKDNWNDEELLTKKVNISEILGFFMP